MDNLVSPKVKTTDGRAWPQPFITKSIYATSRYAYVTIGLLQSAGLGRIGRIEKLDGQDKWPSNENDLLVYPQLFNNTCNLLKLILNQLGARSKYSDPRVPKTLLRIEKLFLKLTFYLVHSPSTTEILFWQSNLNVLAALCRGKQQLSWYRRDSP